MDSSDIITATSITHSFGNSTPVLSNISLRIPRGQFVSIVGPSGCGKTTLLNLIAGLIKLEDGSITIDGIKPQPGRSDIAYMMARDGLLPWLTARDNAEFGALIRNIPSTDRRERAAQLLQQVGLSGAEERYPKELSHGMRQRVALARTFCLPSSLLLMDEPFGALDAQTKLQLEDVLLNLWDQEKRTVVFITHDLSEAIMISDRVIVLARHPGRIQADIMIDLGRPRSVQELQRDLRYHELYAQLWTQLELALSSAQ